MMGITLYTGSTDDTSLQIYSQVALANALHQTGQLAEAENKFSQAERMQKEWSRYPILYTIQGVHYCDLLLSQGKYQEVQTRSNQMLDIAEQEGFGILAFASAYLSLGRAHLLHAQQISEFSNTSEISQVLIYLNRAVDGLQQAREHYELARGLLARAEYYRVAGDLDRAQRDLDEAFTIASRGGMGLHLADCHLEYARLALAESNLAKVRNLRKVDEAREHLKIAKEMIEKMSYHRRDKEVEELEMSLRGTA